MMLLMSFILSSSFASGPSFKDACLGNPGFWKRQVKSVFNERLNPKADQIKNVNWTAYCNCYSQKKEAQKIAKGKRTPEDHKKLMVQDQEDMVSCVEEVGFSSTTAPTTKAPPPASAFFSDKIKNCSTNTTGQTLLIESTLKTVKDPRLEKVRSMSLPKYCECYYKNLRQELSEEHAKLVASYDSHKIQPVSEMLRVNQVQDESVEKCVNEQIPFPSVTAQLSKTPSLDFAKIYNSQFTIGKGLGEIQIGISRARLFEILGPTNVMTTRKDYEEYRFGPNLSELKIRTSPLGENGKVIYVSVNYLFHGPISHGIKKGEMFETVKEKMKPWLPAGEDRHMGFLLYKEGAQFSFADYNKGTLEGLIAFEPSTHPLLKGK